MTPEERRRRNEEMYKRRPVRLTIRGFHRGYLSVEEACDLIRDLTNQVRVVEEG